MRLPSHYWLQRPFLRALSLSLLTTLLVACNDNEGDIDVAKQLANSPLNGEPLIAVGAKTTAIHYAKLGPLQNATVTIYDPMDKSTALATGTTTANGSFNLALSQSLPQLRPLILQVEGGG